MGGKHLHEIDLGVNRSCTMLKPTLCQMLGECILCHGTGTMGLHEAPDGRIIRLRLCQIQ